ncbi:hypothetical protein BVRB_1g019580 [Beta vulgaris subsp. vulgaris]|nr:hypothetical protein BVRB_1g019580 [Beta vulgaris subsp. vulgaris]
MVANVITELDDTPVDFAAAGPNARSYVQVPYFLPLSSKHILAVGSKGRRCLLSNHRSGVHKRC